MLQTYEGVVHRGAVRLPAGLQLPEGARVYVTVVPTLDEHTARRKANRWLIENVGNMVMADRPTLTQAGGRAVWRFEAFVTALSHEPLGPIGHVDVDAATGEVLADTDTAEEMIHRGQRLESTLLPAES